MVKLTIIGRISDGMPLAQGSKYTDGKNDSLSHYTRQAEFILKEISRGSLTLTPKFIIRLDHQQSFNCLIGKGVCFITLCDSWYPKTLAFDYLEDLRLELEKFQQCNQLIDNITRPYTFVKFDVAISSIRKRYVDTRTQANLKKIINANRGHDLEMITTENMSTIVERKIQEDYFERVVPAPQVVSPIWSSPRLEVIALKWMPIGITISVVLTILLWASLITEDYLVLSS